ncbi:hypothetical protein C8D95_101683 [Silicimonas algicola]|uniref:Uncharacterized protein n=2 Tax=Silicimonas algicola TaxID=1826607 RepID=A0A316GFZ6_9RHOB|nr:hypothetical protein C8D95_101683 [Silicimonas algicola]
MIMEQPVSCPNLAAFRFRAYLLGMTQRNRSLSILAVAALCSAAPLAAQSASSIAAEAEFPNQTVAIVAATSSLFDSVEGPESAQRRRAPAIRIPQLETRASFDGDAKAEALTQNGPVRHLTGYRITWYPIDRFLGTVDFMGTWDGNRNLVCGYVTWDLSDTENPVLEQVDASYLSLDDLSAASPADAHQMLLDANCAYGDIDANYAFFD